MIENKYNNRKLDLGIKIIKVKNISSLLKLTNKLNRQNVKFSIIAKKRYYEIYTSKTLTPTISKLDLSRGGVVLTLFKGTSADEKLPDTPNTPPPSKSKDKDLSDR